MNIDKALLDKVADALFENTEGSFDIDQTHHAAADTRSDIIARKLRSEDNQKTNADEQ